MTEENEENEVTELARVEDLRRRYLADQIETATPEQRLLMLFDRLLRDLERADEAFGVMAFETINDNLQHAQQILFALRDPLDRETPLGHALSGIYTYCLGRLIEANLHKDRSALAPARQLLGEIATANRTAAQALVARGSGGAFEGVA